MSLVLILVLCPPMRIDLVHLLVILSILLLSPLSLFNTFVLDTFLTIGVGPLGFVVCPLFVSAISLVSFLFIVPSFTVIIIMTA